jgi:DNA-binding HxlR family transcriptional regulator
MAADASLYDGPMRQTRPTSPPGPAASTAPDVGSSLDAALSRIGDRWSLLVVAALLDGPLRFKELSRVVHPIAPNILTDRLRRLARSGVIASAPYSARPVRLEYRLTEDGAELGDVLRMLAGWGGSATAAEGPRHAACGTALAARWFCPTCARIVDATEGSDLVRL